MEEERCKLNSREEEKCGQTEDTLYHSPSDFAVYVPLFTLTDHDMTQSSMPPESGVSFLNISLPFSRTNLTGILGLLMSLPFSFHFVSHFDK